MPEFTFPKSRRLRNSAEFNRVYALKQRVSDPHLLIFGATNDLGHSRIGLSVSRKQGNAVRRSRLKRLLREAFRLSQHDLPLGYDWILIPKVGTQATAEQFLDSLAGLTKRMAKRLQKAAKKAEANSP